MYNILGLLEISEIRLLSLFCVSIVFFYIGLVDVSVIVTVVCWIYEEVGFI